MTDEHAAPGGTGRERDLATELRALADAVLDRVEPIVRRLDDGGAGAGVGVDAGSAPRQGCSWCPLCAFAALVRGERHDLLTSMSGELDAVIRMLRELVRDHDDRHPAPDTPPATDSAPEAGTSRPAPPPRGPSYVPIEVTVNRRRTARDETL